MTWSTASSPDAQEEPYESTDEELSKRLMSTSKISDDNEQPSKLARGSNAADVACCRSGKMSQNLESVKLHLKSLKEEFRQSQDWPGHL